MLTDPVVFGVELNFLLKREAADGDVLPGAIPFVIERCLHEIESRGLSEVGICMFYDISFLVH
jgi:GTPase-activating protein BEM2